MQNSPFHVLFKEQETEFRCCTSMHLVELKESWVCESCGAIHCQKLLVQENATLYNAEDIKKKKLNESRWRDFGPRTTIGTHDADLAGLSAEKRSRFKRLGKIQGSLIGSIERNLSEAKPQLTQLAEALNLPKFVMETAWRIYERVAQKQLTMGRSIRSFIAASLYIAVRIHNFPCLLDQVVDISMVTDRNLHQNIQMVNAHVLPELNMKYSHNTDFKNLINMVGAKLNFSSEVISLASKLCDRATKRGLTCNGKNPKGLVAACLYRASVELKVRKPQQEIATAACVTEVTLRSRLKDLEHCVPCEKKSKPAKKPLKVIEE